ncbi:MAG TPA: hypothetical protein PK671_12680 [Candidatus Obscuribacter sp.]|nr:hypothetical protein [Candidatus Obscuribacter sp.]
MLRKNRRRLVLASILSVASSVAVHSGLPADAAGTANGSGTADGSKTAGGIGTNPNTGANASAGANSSTGANPSTGTNSSESAAGNPGCTGIPAVDPAAVPVDPSTTPFAKAAASPPLSGSVESVALVAETGLKEVGETLHHLKDATWGLFSEVQQPNMFFAGGPDVVGPIIITPVNGSGFIQGEGFVPPRKKWVDFYIDHVQYLAPQLEKEIAALVLPDGVSDDTRSDLETMKQISIRMPKDCENLIKVSQGPKYDNMAIATAAQVLIDDLKTIDKARKEVYKGVKLDLHQAERKARERKN